MLLNQLTAEMIKLRQDLTFVRNLSLTGLLAIACLCCLSDLQRHNTGVTNRASITNISNSTSFKLIVEHK